MRVALLAVGMVIITIGAASFASFHYLSGQLKDEITQQLSDEANSAFSLGGPPRGHDAGQALQAVGLSITVIRGGTATMVQGRVPTPVNWSIVRQATAQRPEVRPIGDGMPHGPKPIFTSGYSDGVHMETATVSLPNQTVIIVGLDLTHYDHTVAMLELVTIGVGVAAVIVAFTGGLAIAGGALRPVKRLIRATDSISRTRELNTEPIPVEGNDEIASLARSFNSMLAALNSSRQRQRQLVADAGHELRTPLTSLRANIDLLIQVRRHPERPLPHGTLDALLSDVKEQAKELTSLVADLVSLARDEEVANAPAVLHLDEVVRRAVERVQRRAPAAGFVVRLEPWAVNGSEPDLTRAVTNLLDNAVKFSPPDGTVNVTLRAGVLTVSDEGPGIAPDDLPYVFERFYRSAEARALPGSGLGLSIVAQAAEQHGGTASAANGPRGAVITMAIPGAPSLNGH
jgi:two-component system sensor histidine kinase MprB